MNIYIGNLPYSTTEDDLNALFSAYGEVSSINIIQDKYSGQSKGFGFAEMTNDSEGEEAIKALNGHDIEGRSLRVDQARPKEERPQRNNY